MQFRRLQAAGRPILGSTPRRVFLCVALALITCASAAVAGVASTQSLLPGISLSWNDCPGGATASSDLSYACNANTDNFSLICSAVISSSLDQCIGADLVLDIQSSQSTIPDWWRF
jgi:hypothetical protein